MRKKILSFAAVIILTLSVCMTALAEEETSVVPPVQEHGGTAAELKSHGRIVYQKGTESVKIDSDDLYMLADQIDQVKLDVTDQLKALNTYFSTGDGICLSTSEDINVVHATPTEENSVDPLDVNFDTLLEGIAVSQSVSPDVTAYGYPAGTELYKNASGVLTTNGSEKGAEKIDVTAATADNLSAGTAAWVNGNLILGTGGDNKSYHDQGAGFKKARVTLRYTVQLWSSVDGDRTTPLTIECIINNDNGILSISESYTYSHIPVSGIYPSQALAVYISFNGGSIEIIEP